MQRLKKGLIFLLLAMLLAAFPAAQGLASELAPGSVKRLTSKLTSETTAELKWSEATGATGYAVYLVNLKKETEERVAHTKGTMLNLKNLKPGKEYTYQVYAFRETKEGKKIKNPEPSPQTTVKTYVRKPGRITGLQLTSAGDGSIQLKWNRATDATGYYIYRYSETKEQYVEIGDTRSTSYQVEKIGTGKKYRFYVQAYRTVRGVTMEGERSEKISGAANNFTKKVHGRYFNATIRNNTTATVIETGKKVSIARGTRVIATARSGKPVTVVKMNGVRLRIKGNQLRYNSLNTLTSRDFSREAKEEFVNERGYTSPSRYLIWISQYTMQVNVFNGSKGKWKLVRTMPCVIGRGGKTPMGTFRLLFKDYAYGGIRIYFTWNQIKVWGNSFHRRVDGNTRAAVSSGCIRLGDGDLSYINNTCPLGTTVVSY